MLELYHNNMSVCAQKVRLTLAEKGIAATEHHLNLRAGDQQQPDYRKLNPKAYVPTLVHDGAVVTESTVICEYLDEVFPDPPLRPADPMGRAIMRRWTRRPDERIHVACVVISNTIAFRYQWLARPAEELAATIANTPDYDVRERRRDIIENGTESPRFKSAVMAYDSLLSDMQQTLSASVWLSGPAYTLADIGILPYINRLAQLKLDSLWDTRPAIARWFDAVRDRDSYEAAIANYDDDGYVALMANTGREHRAAVQAVLS